MTAVQTFLRGGGTLDDLRTTYGITAKRHRELTNLVLLKYNQIESPFAEPIVRECRGIILDEADDWRVVSWAFSKFFNHGEGHAAPIDWLTARVQEKKDGSLAVLYPYRGVWHVATSGTPDASGEVHGGGKSFADYFWETFGNEVLPPVDCGVCLYFELTGPLNRIVVVHEKPSLTLLGARHLVLGEMPLATITALSTIPRVREFPLQSWDDIASSFAAISPLSQEGYVVVDANFNRVKVKHPGYVALHHAKDGLGPKAFVEIARSGETSEVLTAFPEFAPLLSKARTQVDALVADIEADYGCIASIETQKAFALEATKTRHSAALFCLRSKRSESARAFVRDMHIDRLVELLDAREAVAP